MPASNSLSQKEIAPLASLDEWEEDVLKRYPEADIPAKQKKNSGIMKSRPGIQFGNFTA